MSTNLFLIHKSITLNAPIKVSIKSAHFIQQSINCVVFEWVKTNERVRFHLLNEYYEPLFDDTFTPQIMTVNIKDIKALTINKNFYYAYKDGLLSMSQSYLDKVNHESPWMIDAYKLTKLLAKPLIKEVIDSSIEMLSDDTERYESVYLVEEDDRFIPLVYRKIAYDIIEKTLIKKELCMHEHVNKYLNNPGLDLADESILLKLLKKDTNVVKKAVLFDIEYKLKGTLKKAINHYKKGPLDRPLRAYYNQISKKNLGRKDYRLGFTNENLNLYYNQLSLSSMKHPLTAIRLANQDEMNAYLQTLIMNSLLNQLSVMIIDQDQLLAASYPAQTLDLRHHTLTLTFNDEEVSNQTILNTYDYEPFFNHITSVNNQAKRINEANYYTYYFQSREDFHESIITDSYYERLINRPLECDISLLYEKLYQLDDLNHYINKMTYLNHQKRFNKKYKKVRELEHSLDTKTMYHLLKDPFMRHHLKQLFPIFISKDTETLKHAIDSFDLVVILNPKESNLLDMAHAKKVTLLYDSLYDNPILKPLDALSDDLIKRYTSENALTLIVHDVKSQNEHHEHISNTEIDAMRSYLNHSLNHYAIRTFFNAQKDAIKKALNTHAETLYEPLGSQNHLISLGLNQTSNQANYDWVKEHPFMIDHLKDNTPYQTHLFLDYDLMLTFNTKDRLSKLVTKALKQPFNHTMLDDYLVRESITYYEKNIPLSKLILGLHTNYVNQARYVLYDEHYHLKIVICLIQAYASELMMETITKKFRKESIELIWITEHALKHYERKMHVLETIGRIIPL
jgi:hypothetical protein